MKDFLDYIKIEKKKAGNTIVAYERDLKGFEKYLESRGIDGLDGCSDSDAVAYVLEMGNENKSRSTINRRVSSLRKYYEYKIGKGELSHNPFARIRTAKTENRKIDHLTIEETGKLMMLPMGDKKGIRDRALLEFMYGTGARVSEIVRLRFEDMNLRMNFVTLRDMNDESRIVPLGSYASDAMANYIKVYSKLSGRAYTEHDHVFLNMRGEPLTRQGIWRILKDYGEMLGVGERMTPQILRDSFAVHILQNGGDLKTIQELMGFEDMTIGIAYLAVIDIHVRDVYKKCHPRA